MNPHEVEIMQHAHGLGCPLCQNPIHLGDLSDRHPLCACGAGRLQHGIIYFSDGQSSHGEFSASEMGEFLEIARRQGWRRALSDYADPRKPRVRMLIDGPSRTSFLEALPSATGREAALDLGCGYGGLAAGLTSHFGTVYALDGSRDRLGFLRLRADQDGLRNLVPIVHNDPRRLPFADGSLDMISLFGVLEYLPQIAPDKDPVEVQGRCLQEMARVLRPNGSLVIGTKNRFGWNFLLGSHDHNNIPFGPALPRWLANRISKIRFNRDYNIINHGFYGYIDILKSNFHNMSILWPLPSYQRPEILCNPKASRSSIAKEIEPFFGVATRSVLNLVATIRLLHMFTPNFVIIATK